MIALIRQWLERRRVRRELLATPGVDLLVQRVMDAKYGKHGWRVVDGMLEANVQVMGQGNPFWGRIGKLDHPITRMWLRDGGKPADVSHAKLIPEPVGYEGPYDDAYLDTEPLDDDGRTAP